MTKAYMIIAVASGHSEFGDRREQRQTDGEDFRVKELCVVNAGFA